MGAIVSAGVSTGGADVELGATVCVAVASTDMAVGGTEVGTTFGATTQATRTSREISRINDILFPDHFIYRSRQDKR